MVKEKYIKENIHYIVNEVANYSLTHIGFLEGKTGVALFLSEYLKQFTNSNFSKILNGFLVEIQNEIEQFPVAMNYANGISGILSVFNIIEVNTKRKFVIVDSDIDRLILDSFKKSITKNEYELFFGGLGYVKYFLNRPDSIAKRYLPVLLIGINEIRKQDKQGIYWTSYYKRLYDRNFINFGLSHGMAAIISVLSTIPDTIPDLTLRTQLVKGLFAFYKNNINDVEKYNSIFPYGISEKSEERNSRLAWCYGDAGIGISFLNAGLKLNNSEIEKFGKEILHHSANRKINKLNGINDPYFCHGSSGLTIIFLNAYKMTGDIIFEEAAYYWLGITLNFLESSKFLNTSFLTGLSGVGLVLLSFINEGHLPWEKLVLIN